MDSWEEYEAAEAATETVSEARVRVVVEEEAVGLVGRAVRRVQRVDRLRRSRVPASILLPFPWRTARTRCPCPSRMWEVQAREAAGAAFVVEVVRSEAESPAEVEGLAEAGGVGFRCRRGRKARR